VDTKSRAIIILLCISALVLTSCHSIGSPTVDETPKSSSVTENASPHQSINSPSVSPAATQASVKKSGSQEKIVFWSLRDCTWVWDWSKNMNQVQDENYEIYIMDPDGRNQVRLTNNSDLDLMPSLSPDGTKILFVSDRKWEADNQLDNNYDVYVMDVDGTNVKNLTGHKAWDSMPCWSPDGSMIAFCSSHSGWESIWITDRDGKNFLDLKPERNAADADFPIWPSWSPDGNKILYTSGQSGTYDIFYFEIDYDRIKQIVLDPSKNNYSVEAWSSIGDRRVVKQSLLNPRSVVKSKAKLDLGSTDYASKASFSPDGKKIAYEMCRRDNSVEVYDIYVADADGTNVVNLTNSLGIPGRGQFNDWPTWSPDGKKISFISDRDGKPADFGIRFKYAWQIYTMDADGSNVIRIINNNYADGSPSWASVPDERADKIKIPTTAPFIINTEATISALDIDQVRKYIGKDVAIEGNVVEYGSSWDVETRPTLLYFDNPKQHCTGLDEWKQGQCGTDFRVVITKQDLKKFPDVFTYLNNKVRIEGKIEYYKGAPCIILHDPQQITILE
jgi:Tol biopolymer transport system component